MPGWLRLKRNEMDPPRKEKIAGITVDVTMAPQDVPLAVRGVELDDDDRFLIEFRYADDEEWTYKDAQEGVQLRVGRHSGRLYGIEIPRGVVESQGGRVDLRFNMVEELIDHQIDQLRRKNRSRRRSRWKQSVVNNWQAAKRAIGQRRDDLFSATR